jgi:hypothetical protein
MLVGLIIVFVWLFTGFLAYGFGLAVVWKYNYDWYKEKSNRMQRYEEDRRDTLYMSLGCGPIALAISLLNEDFKCGFKIW